MCVRVFVCVCVHVCVVCECICANVRMCTYMQLCVMCVHEYLPLAETAHLGQASTAMRTINDISTTELSMELCTVLCCCGVVENGSTMQGSPYTFFVKPKWRMVGFWFFATHSSAEAYLHTSPPRGYSTVGVPKRCEGFVAIWLCAFEEFADNRFNSYLYI